MRKALAQSWASFAIGRTDFHVEATVSKQKNWVNVHLRLRGPDSKAHFHLLHDRREMIEQQMQHALHWQELPANELSRIDISREVDNVLDEDDWPRQHAWLADMLERFHQVFRPLVLDLDASDWIPEEGELDVAG